VALLGDSDLFAAEALEAFPANAAFLQSLVRWLLQSGPTGPPRDPLPVRAPLSEAEHRRLLHGLTTLPSGVTLLLGLLAWRRYRARALHQA
jgi:hypothetical protein